MCKRINFDSSSVEVLLEFLPQNEHDSLFGAHIQILKLSGMLFPATTILNFMYSPPEEYIISPPEQVL